MTKLDGLALAAAAAFSLEATSFSARADTYLSAATTTPALEQKVATTAENPGVAGYIGAAALVGILALREVYGPRRGQYSHEAH